MKKMLLFFLLIALSIIIFVQYSNHPKTLIAKLSTQKAIKAGELKYELYLWGLIPMGEAIFKKEKAEKYRDKDVYHLSASARPFKIWQRFYNASAIIDSYIDKERFQPLTFRQKVVIPGRQEIDKEVFYDQSGHIMSLDGIERKIPPDTLDPLSALFNISRTDFAQTEEIELNINTNQKTYLLMGNVSREKILVNKKTYDTFLIRAKIGRRDKNPYHQTNISMLLLKEEENIPILIKVFTSGLLMNIRLVEIN